MQQQESQWIEYIKLFWKWHYYSCISYYVAAI